MKYWGKKSNVTKMPSSLASKNITEHVEIKYSLKSKSESYIQLCYSARYGYLNRKLATKNFPATPNMRHNFSLCIYGFDNQLKICLKRANVRHIKSNRYFIMIGFEIDKLENVEKTLKVLLDEIPSFHEILPEICQTIGSSFHITGDYLIQQHDYDFLFDKVKKAQCQKKYNTAWELVNNYYDQYSSGMLLKTIDDDKILTLLQLISSKSPYFKYAQEKCVEVLLQISREGMSGSDRLKLLQQQFKHSLNTINQERTDIFFHELCGNSGDKPHLTNIKGDFSTLVNCSMQMRSQNKKLRKQKRKTKKKEILSRGSRTHFFTSSESNTPTSTKASNYHADY